MVKRIDPADALERLTRARPEYDFSRFVYAGSGAKGVVICPHHGEFSARYDALIQGHGCPTCANMRKGAFRALSHDEAIHRMQSYKPEYDYSKFEYTGAARKSVVICSAHGEFLMTYQDIKGGHGCPKCKGDKVRLTHTFTQTEAVSRMRAVAPHYDYSRFIYRGSVHKGLVVCEKHGEFETSYDLIYSGRGCMKCGIESRTDMCRLSPDEAVRRMVEAFPEYDYSQFVYTKSGAKSVVVCPVHGEFETTHSAIMSGVGCARCAWARLGAANAIPFPEFVRRAREVHGDHYTYHEDGYSGTSGYVITECPTHGKFKVLCNEHTGGQGCPDCKDTQFNPKKRAFLYIYKLEKEGRMFLGYGITKSIRRRHEEHMLRTGLKGYAAELVDIYRFRRGYVCRDVERIIGRSFESINLGVPGFKREAMCWSNYDSVTALVKRLHLVYKSVNDFQTVVADGLSEV